MLLARIGRYLEMLFADNSFRDAINAVEPFLADYGVVFEQVKKYHYAGRKEYRVRGRSKNIRIDISTESHIVSIGIAPLEYKEEHIEHGKVLYVERNIGLPAILWFLAHDVQFVPKYVRSSIEMREEIGRQVQLLINYCRPILEGDFSAWHSIVESSRAITGPTEGETMDEWKLMMKQKLSDALDKENYLLAKQLCLYLRMHRVGLTREEQENCNLAAKEVEKLAR